MLPDKGQIKSEWISEIINSPKNEPKHLKDFCPMYCKNSQFGFEIYWPLALCLLIFVVYSKYYYSTSYTKKSLNHVQCTYIHTLNTVLRAIISHGLCFFNLIFLVLSTASIHKWFIIKNELWWRFFTFFFKFLGRECLPPMEFSV